VSNEDRQRRALDALLQEELRPGEKVLAVLPFSSTKRRPREPGQQKVMTGVWTTSSRYRPLVLTDRRLLIFETGRTPHPRWVVADYPVDHVRIVDFQRASLGRHTVVFELPELGDVPFTLGRYEPQDLAPFLATLHPDPDEE